MEKYELWVAGTTVETRQRLFVREDHNGDRLRKRLPEDAIVEWFCSADSFFEAMQKYWKYSGFGEYTSEDHIFPGEELLPEVVEEDEAVISDE